MAKKSGKSSEEILLIRQKNIAAAREGARARLADAEKKHEFPPERIRAIRSALKMSGQDFQRVTGVDIGKWERSESTPNSSGIAFLYLIEHFGATAIEAMRQGRRRHRENADANAPARTRNGQGPADGQSARIQQESEAGDFQESWRP